MLAIRQLARTVNGQPERRRGTKTRPPWSPDFAAALTSLRDQVAQHLADPNLGIDLLPLVNRLVSQARADGLRAEHVVVAFHAILDTLPEGHQDSRSQREEIRTSVVTSLVTAYYDTELGPGTV